MESQIQCPVCTLYLHAGMNLQDHLESHPKEKVIAALVNLTLFQQQSNDECIEEYDCNQYETPDHMSETQLAPVTLPVIRTMPQRGANRSYNQNDQAITSFGGPAQHYSAAPAAHQVMIVDRTRVFHERSNVEINDESCRRRILTKPVPSIIAAQSKIRTIPVQTLQLITTNGLATNQQIQCLRPPPPYCVSVKDNSLKQKQNELSSHSNEFADQLQRNNYQPCELLTTAACRQDVNINAMTTVEANEHRKHSTQNIYNADEQIQVGYEDGYNLDEEVREQQTDANTDEKLAIVAGTDTNNETTAQEATSPVVAEKSTEETIGSYFKMEKNIEKRTAGLQVISNVKVTPNTVLNISSLNSHIGDTVSMKDVIIIGAASTSNSSLQKLVPMASTSRTSPQVHPSNNNESNLTDKNEAKNLVEVSRHSVRKTNIKCGEK